jgi:hypothetical protein
MPAAQKSEAPLYRRRVVLLIACLGLTAIIIVVGYFNHVAGTAEMQRLIGNWVRQPDSEYFLVVQAVMEDGRAEVRYFNPKPIKVAEAKVDHDGKALRLFVKLDDIGYPGSTYTLLYEPEKDELHGVYFQAVEKENFEVYFTREK